MLSTIQKTFVFLHQKAIFGDIKNNKKKEQSE